MWPDTVSPIATAAATAARAAAAPAAPPAQGFAALLDAQQRSPEDLPTVTLGEMTGLIPTPQAMPVLATATAAGVAAVPQAPATATDQMVMPVHGGRITSEFGPRTHPVTGAHRDHHGLDIAAATGTPIGAAADGKVTFAGSQGGYGNVVIVDHGNGTETRYAHQDTIAVTVGQSIRAGQRVGTVGSTGMSTGPHLHFEVRRHGEPVDPRRFLR